jgi:hypothetical protein|tara:strand:+ start:1505 stop:1735 length:231 start_codon:yes stop_codon:yes gene_type:complete
MKQITELLLELLELYSLERVAMIRMMMDKGLDINTKILSHYLSDKEIEKYGILKSKNLKTHFRVNNNYPPFGPLRP